MTWTEDVPSVHQTQNCAFCSNHKERLGFLDFCVFGVWMSCLMRFKLRRNHMAWVRFVPDLRHWGGWQQFLMVWTQPGPKALSAICAPRTEFRQEWDSCLVKGWLGASQSQLHLLWTHSVSYPLLWQLCPLRSPFLHFVTSPCVYSPLSYRWNHHVLFGTQPKECPAINDLTKQSYCQGSPFWLDDIAEWMEVWLSIKKIARKRKRIQHLA